MAYVILIVIYLCDVATPADLSLEVGYEVPVAVAALTARRGAVVRLAVAAALANVVGYATDATFAPLGDPIGFQNRVIALASLTLVCALAIVVQSAAAKEARLDEQQRALDARRELASEIARRGEILVERQHVIGELVEAIAHDVRTPLEALSLTLGQALRGQYGALPESYLAVARESRLSIGDITRLAETLLAVARFESRTALPEVTAVDAAAIVRDVVGEFTALADARDVAITHDVPIEALVLADASDLRRAIANVVANAIKHSTAGGRVLLELTRSGALWRIDVVDNGVGVAPEAVPQLFARYSHGAGGTGLGLHIVKRIAESVGGSVAYEPVVPTGSRFSISLAEAAAA